MRRYKGAFTLTEILIAMAVIGIIAAILLPFVSKIMPNRNIMLAKKTYNTVKNIVYELINDEACYPDLTQATSKRFGLDNRTRYVNCEGWQPCDTITNSSEKQKCERGDANEKFATLFTAKMKGATLNPNTGTALLTYPIIKLSDNSIYAKISNGAVTGKDDAEDRLDTGEGGSGLDEIEHCIAPEVWDGTKCVGAPLDPKDPVPPGDSDDGDDDDDEGNNTPPEKSCDEQVQEYMATLGCHKDDTGKYDVPNEGSFSCGGQTYSVIGCCGDDCNIQFDEGNDWVPPSEDNFSAWNGGDDDDDNGDVSQSDDRTGSSINFDGNNGDDPLSNYDLSDDGYYYDPDSGVTTSNGYNSYTINFTKNDLEMKILGPGFKAGRMSFVTIVVDVDGPNQGSNCGQTTPTTVCGNDVRHYDKFAMRVYADGTIMVMDDWAKEAINVNKNATGRSR